LADYRVGNIDLVASLRAELKPWPERFTMILSRVIYDGVHSGDFISATEVPHLVPEVEALAGIHCPDPEMEHFMREFEVKMKKLVAVALRVRKPIAF
jgi:hypothetical protein